MKKIIVCIMALALSCILLCACGNSRMNANNPVGSANPAVTATPNGGNDVQPTDMPDASDGIVDDKNGIIGDDGKGGMANNDSLPGNGAAVSPVPTALPSATVNP